MVSKNERIVIHGDASVIEDNEPEQPRKPHTPEFGLLIDIAHWIEQTQSSDQSGARVGLLSPSSAVSDKYMRLTGSAVPTDNRWTSVCRPYRQ